MNLLDFFPSFIVKKIVFYCDNRSQYNLLLYDFDRFFPYSFFNFSARESFIEYCIKHDGFKKLVFLEDKENRNNHLLLNLGYAIYKEQPSPDSDTWIKCFCGTDLLLRNFERHVNKSFDKHYAWNACRKCHFIAPRFNFHRYECREIIRCPVCHYRIEKIIGNKYAVRIHLDNCVLEIRKRNEIARLQSINNDLRIKEIEKKEEFISMGVLFFMGIGIGVSIYQLFN